MSAARSSINTQERRPLKKYQKWRVARYIANNSRLRDLYLSSDPPWRRLKKRSTGCHTLSMNCFIAPPCAVYQRGGWQESTLGSCRYTEIADVACIFSWQPRSNQIQLREYGSARHTRRKFENVMGHRMVVRRSLRCLTDKNHHEDVSRPASLAPSKEVTTKDSKMDGRYPCLLSCGIPRARRWAYLEKLVKPKHKLMAPKLKWNEMLDSVRSV